MSNKRSSNKSLSGLTKSCLLAAAVALGVSGPVCAKPAPAGDSAAYEVSKELDRRSRGYDDFTVNLTMVLVDHKGKRSERSMKLKTLEASQAAVKTLIKFETPRDLKGTSLLVHSNKSKVDEQWIYMPELKRVKKIASSNKTGSFVGSEFSFEDMGTPELNDYVYYDQGEEVLNVPGLGDTPCYVIDRIPNDKHSGYSKQRVWIDKENYRTIKVDFYDRKEALLKTLKMSGYALHENQYWYPGRMLMQNHQTKRSTELIWANYQFKNGLKESGFEQRKLKLNAKR